jgi:arginase family enzyme
MDLVQFLDFFDDEFLVPKSAFISRHVKFLHKENEDLTGFAYRLAILGLPDSGCSGSFDAANKIRKSLYEMSDLSNSLKIIDLGNVILGESFPANCYIVRDIINELNTKKAIILLIGGSSIYSIGNLLAQEKTHIPMNIVSIDSTFSREKIPFSNISEFTQDNTELLGSVNYINIGYQSYYVDKKALDFIEDSYFEAYRLGSVRANIKDMEPVLRDANIINFSMNAVKHADAPGTTFGSPNGLSGDEACQLAFYSGHSNRIKSFGVFDLFPENDLHSTTAKLSAQIIWYFLEGVSNVIYEEPDINPEHFTKYLIHNNQTDQHIAFYKSNLTNRWWMEITFSKRNHNIILSCSEADYDLCCKQEIPDRWWQTFRRLSD